MKHSAAGRKQLSANKGPTYMLAEWLNANWDRLTDKTNEEVASEFGYARANIVSMWRTGKTRVPLKIVPKLARLLDVSVAQLMSMWVEQYLPDSEPEILGMFNRLVSKNEAIVVETVRYAKRDEDTKPTVEQLEKVYEIFGHTGDKPDTEKLASFIK